jgi:hypothetical protein
LVGCVQGPKGDFQFVTGAAVYGRATARTEVPALVDTRFTFNGYHALREDGEGVEK